MGQKKDWRLDPRLAEEENARQEKMNQAALAQQAQLGDIQAKGIKGLGDAASSTVTGAVNGYYEGQKQGMDRKMAEENLSDSQQKREQQKADYDFLNQSEEGAASRKQQTYDINTQKTQAEIDKMNAEAEKAGRDPKVAEITPYQRELLAIQNKRLKMEGDRSKLAQEKADKPKPLPASEQARMDNATMGLAAIEDMTKAHAAGDNTFSIIGDNDYTQARTRFEEAIGRMQSGGAINDDEAKRFRGMAPTSWDSAPMQKKKLQDMANEMANRVRSMGLDPDQVMAARKSHNYQLPQGGAPGTAMAAPGSAPKPANQMTDDELDAELMRLQGNRP